jgi:hypothetical protein
MSSQAQPVVLTYSPSRRQSHATREPVLTTPPEIVTLVLIHVRSVNSTDGLQVDVPCFPYPPLGPGPQARMLAGLWSWLGYPEPLEPVGAATLPSKHRTSTSSTLITSRCPAGFEAASFESVLETAPNELVLDSTVFDVGQVPCVVRLFEAHTVEKRWAVLFELEVLEEREEAISTLTQTVASPPPACCISRAFGSGHVTHVPGPEPAGPLVEVGLQLRSLRITGTASDTPASSSAGAGGSGCPGAPCGGARISGVMFVTPSSQLGACGWSAEKFSASPLVIAKVRVKLLCFAFNLLS